MHGMTELIQVMPHGQRTADRIAIGIAMGNDDRILWLMYQLFQCCREFHGYQIWGNNLWSIGCPKAGKSTGFTPDLQGWPDIIFLKTFFCTLFEIKSCPTFATLK